MQAGIIIRTILYLWETPGIEPVTSSHTSVETKVKMLAVEL